MSNKLPVVWSVAQAWTMFKFRPVAPAIYLIVSMLLGFVPLAIISPLVWDDIYDFFNYGVASSGVALFYAAFFISIFLITIFSIGFYKMLRDAYYKEKSSFSQCWGFSLSKALKVALFMILIMILISAAAFALTIPIGIIVYMTHLISENLAIIIAAIAYIGFIIALFPLTVAFYFAFYSVIFTSKSIWQSIGHGFSLVFKQGNFWRSVALLLLQYLIIIAAYSVVAIIGLLLFHILPISVITIIATIAYLLLISFIAIFSNGTFIAAYESLTQKEQKALETR